MTVSSPTSAPPRAHRSDAAPPRHRLRFWRSPDDQPRWARPALLGIAALAAVLYAWNITSSGYAMYYSVAARSMTESWKAFLFTSLDPSATITMDKIGGFLWPQALSARIFGFSAWALTLPQCVEGVVAVLVMYRMVRRWQGPAAGLLAAGMLTITPVAASMFGHSMLDGSVTMCLVLAADQYQRAVRRGRLRSLLLAGMWVGIGFQAKMMEAWLIVPALAVGYLVAAPPALRKRLGHLAAAGAVMFAVSLSWVALMTFTPENSRPYADGSTNNSAFSMVFGYNGFNRFGSGDSVGGAVPSMGGGGGGQRPPTAGGETPAGQQQRTGPEGAGRQGGTASGGTQGGTGSGGTQGGGAGRQGGEAPGGTQGGGSPGGTQGGAAQGEAQGGPQGRPAGGGGPGGKGDHADDWLKLTGSRLAPQIGWLYPLALIALVLGLVRHRRTPRTDQARGGYLMWGVWLVTTAGVLSAIHIPHTAYTATLAPALAALSAAGLVAMWRDVRAGNRLWLWALPVTIVAETLWTVHLAQDFTDFAPWLVPLVLVTAVGAVLALGFLALRSARSARTPDEAGPPRGARVRRIGVAGLLAGCVAMLAAPAAWSLSVLDVSYAGSAFDAAAGPSAEGGGGRGGPGGGGGGGGFGRTASTGLTTAQQKLLTYVEKRDGDARYTFSTDSWSTASSYILGKGLPVLPLGGFSGEAKSFSLAEYKKLVADGDLRFALVGAEGGMRGGMGGRGGTTTETSRITAWVTSACEKVDAAAYGGDTEDSDAAAGPGAAASTTLYSCSPADTAS